MAAVSEAVRKINSFRFPTRTAEIAGEILGAIDATHFAISIGSNEGLKLGDVINVYREVPVRNTKGEIIYTEKKQIASLQVEDVQAQRAKAKLMSGSDIREGDKAIREAPTVDVDEYISRGLDYFKRNFMPKPSINSMKQKRSPSKILKITQER